MQAAVLDKPTASGSVDTDRLRAMVLVRIASAAGGVSRTEMAGDLAPLMAHRLASARARALIDRAVEALAAAGLLTITRVRLAASDAGLSQAANFLGLKGNLPRSWSHVGDVRLVAKALGMEREPAKRLKALATPDGLRIALLQRAYNLKIKGVVTPSRLRSALAAVALERAFGNQINAGLAGKLGLSAKAGRLLAAQLARKPRDFGTDGRLIAALAAEHIGAPQADLATLRLAVLRRYLDGAAKPHTARQRPAAKAPVARPRLVEPASPPPATTGRPDLAGFAHEVRGHAASRAQGWIGNRKAYISHVWRLVREQRPEWGLSEIEFKCMLAEAHRVGQLALANADLKDNSSLKDVQESAVVYKNAVFHFVRVDV
jgi:hypothetical protein